MDWEQAVAAVNPGTMNRPLAALLLPKKNEILLAEGLTTVGALVESLKSGRLWQIPGVGFGTTRLIEARLGLLPRATKAHSNEVDWQEFAVLCGLDLTPEHDIVSGADFLAVLPAVVDAILDHYENPVDRLILIERLVRQPGERKTLEVIANAAPERITRERVRQRQERLLGGLSNALLHDDYRELGLRFRDSFAESWKVAAELLGGAKEISFAEFLNTLERAWSVSSSEILPHLPLITSVLTSKAQFPQQLKRGMELPPRLHEPVQPWVNRAPISWLATGRSREEIEEHGIRNLGDLIAAGRAGHLPSAHTSAGKCCASLLSAIGKSIGESGELDWKRYGEELGLPTLPETERHTPAEFVRHLNQDIEDVARLSATSLRATDIFRLRTSVPRGHRPTLDSVAKRLGSHGPSIKREETVLLSDLHTQLIQSDFTDSRVMFRPHFRKWWRQAWEVYRGSSGSFETFCSDLGSRWDCNVREGAEVMWAVLSGYPNGRTSRRARERAPVFAAPFEGGTITLRGFRRAH